MTQKEKKQLDFLLSLDIEELKHHVGNIYPSVQEEMFQSYPETFIILSDRIMIVSSVVKQMLASHKKIWLDVLKKQPFTFEDEKAMLELWPEIAKQIQDSRVENDVFLPETEETYHRLRRQNPKLPKIKYIWHPEYESTEEDTTIEQVIRDLDLLS